MHINLLAATLDALTVGSPVIFENLAMLPLVKTEHRTSTIDYALLDDALASGAGEITDVSEAAVVPELKFLNGGSNPVLVVDGEELLGAKQNRVVNLTIL